MYINNKEYIYNTIYILYIILYYILLYIYTVLLYYCNTDIEICQYLEESKVEIYQSLPKKEESLVINEINRENY